jgi:hypothetical protein
VSQAADIVRRSFERFNADDVDGVLWTFTTVWGVRDGLIYYHHGYTDHAEALRAIGAA